MRKVILLIGFLFFFSNFYGQDCRKVLADHISKSPYLRSAILEDPNLTKGWKVLYDIGEQNLENRIEHIQRVTIYLKDNSFDVSQLSKEIKTKGWNIDVIEKLKKDFSYNFSIKLPDNWSSFFPKTNIEFAQALKEFRGNNDLSFDINFRGGEGQLFETPLSNNTVLKRWHEKRIKDMSESIRLLKEARDLVNSNT